METRFSGPRAVKLLVLSLTLLAAILVLAGTAALQARADGGAFPTLTPSSTATFTLIPTLFPTLTSTFPPLPTITQPYPYPYSVATVLPGGEAQSGGSSLFGIACWPIAIILLLSVVIGATALLRRGG